MRTTSTLSVGFLVLGLGGGVASANAFLLAVHDGKAMGRGNAAVATNTDPSSITYNIGGLAVGDGTNVMIGSAVVMPSASYTDLDGVKTDTESSAPIVPHFFATSKVNDMVAVGLGFHAPFGLAIEWPGTAPTNDIVRKQSLRTYFITPSIGVDLKKWVPGLSVGAGLDLVPATVELTRSVFFGDVEGEAHLGGDAFGIGGRVGVMYHPEAVPALSVGAMWRSQVNEDFTGKGDFDIADPYRDQLPPDGDISTSVKIPQSVGVGVAYRPLPQLEIEANALWVDWSKFQEIRIRLADGTDSVAVQNYSDKVTLALGVDYKLTKAAAVRAGYIYDPTPIPDTALTAQLPDADRHDLTVGGSYSFGNFDVNLGILWVLPQSRETSDAMYTPIHKGTYDIQVLVTTLTLGGHFGH
ncbi:MAG: outer membrane protein transport protein [Myxococcales bacterium]|nr:outer membrane protein transport protein [Myxococcales bacterium]